MEAWKSTICHPQAGNQKSWWGIRSEGLMMGPGGPWGHDAPIEMESSLPLPVHPTWTMPP